MVELRGIPALSLVGALALATPRAQADDGVIVLPPLQVSAPSPQLHDSGVVTRIDIDPLAGLSLPELLATLPGVQVRSAGGLGSYSEASLRGSSGRQVRVLLDGLPLDTGGGEATSLSLIDPLLLSHADVYKGHVPISLGSGLAGTIHLHSRQNLPVPLIATVAAGSFGERRLHAAAQATDTIQLAAGTQQADNDFPYVNQYRPYDPTDPNRKRAEPRRNAGIEQNYGLLRYRDALRLSADVSQSRQQLPTRENLPTTRTRLHTDSFSLSLATLESSAWVADLSHRFAREHFADPDSQLGLAAQDRRSDTRRNLLRLGYGFDVGENLASIEHTEYRSEDLRNGAPAATARRLSLGNGVEARFGETWRFNAGINARWTRDEAAGLRDEDWSFEPAMGLARTLGACTLAANAGERERLPTFFERYGDRGLFKGNPALRPESARYADAGARCRGEGRLRRLELSLFAQGLRDAISPTYDAQGVGRSINTERARIFGVEFDSAVAWSAWSASANGTWQRTEDGSSVRATRGKQLPGRFETQWNARIEYALPAVRIHYSFHLEAGQFYDSPNLLPAPTAHRHDLGARGALRDLGWSLQAFNLGDRNFEQFNGFPTPGRHYLLTLSWPASASP